MNNNKELFDKIKNIMSEIRIIVDKHNITSMEAFLMFELMRLPAEDKMTLDQIQISRRLANDIYLIVKTKMEKEKR